LTEEQFTALHFATRHANYTILSLLAEKAGADLLIRNKFGSTVMHIAAQQDQPLSLYYLFKRGMDINIRDTKNSTPIHWACFTRSEMALNYILSMKPNLEVKDSFGFTPLHIAVTCADKLGSTRTVKALLLRGASRNSKDLNGKTPLDHIPDSMPEHMQAELKTQLAAQSYWECLMLRVPLIPLKRNHKTQALFLMLFLVVYLLNMFIILPTIPE
jgi:ankyrin repeat protein